jgi:hypothetical protein
VFGLNELLGLEQLWLAIDLGLFVAIHDQPKHNRDYCKERSQFSLILARNDWDAFKDPLIWIT